MCIRKFTEEVGVCLATSGPDVIHLLNGLYDAKLDHQPVVAIIGQSARNAIGGNYQQEIDLISLFKDVAHEYVHMASDASQIRHLIDRAIRIAKAATLNLYIRINPEVSPHEALPKIQAVLTRLFPQPLLIIQLPMKTAKQNFVLRNV